MKIAIRGGHNYQAKGAIGLLDEVIEDRNILKPAIKYLQLLGHEVLDVTPYNCDMYTDLAYGVNKANAWGADLFISIHLNKAYSNYNGAIGSEVCVYSKFDTAQRVVDGLGSLGFINRGQKVRPELYELANTSMSSMIIEVCFVEATEDVALYKKLGADKIAKTIAESVSNKKLPIPNPIKMYRNIIIYNDGVLADQYCAEFFKMILNNANEDCECISYSEYRKSLKDGYSIFAVGGSLEGKFKYHKLFNGANRNETAQNMLEHLKRY